MDIDIIISLQSSPLEAAVILSAFGNPCVQRVLEKVYNGMMRASAPASASKVAFAEQVLRELARDKPVPESIHAYTLTMVSILFLILRSANQLIITTTRSMMELWRNSGKQ